MMYYSGTSAGSLTSVMPGSSWTSEYGTTSSYTPPNLENSMAEHAFKIHRQTCKLHEEGSISCHGVLKRKQNHCIKKATSFVNGVMPTCKLHQDQIIKASRCKVPLACGKLCGRLCQWVPHSWQRCSFHDKFPMPCYFFKIPLELRTRIYDLLLPDQDVPAIRGTGVRLRTDSKPCQMAILRVNSTIHDEATTYLYSVNTFIINLAKEGLSMCNGRATPTNSWQDRSITAMGNHALQDYQMQLMLLEQQNRRRLLAARQQSFTGVSQSHSHHMPQSTQIPVANSIVNQPQAAGPSNAQSPPQCHSNQIPTSPSQAEHQSSHHRIWAPSLVSRYFDMIRSFRIEINFSTTALVSGQPNDQNPQEQSHQLYSFNDQLHRVVNRFQLNSRAVTRLEIDIGLLDTYSSLEEAVSATDVLLRPFRRLSDVQRANVRSIMMKNPTRYAAQDQNKDHIIDLLTRDAPHANANLLEYLHSFSLALRSPTPSLPPSPIFDGYWKLCDLIDKILKHCNTHTLAAARDISGIFKVSEFKHTARVAREDGDSKAFKEVFERVLDIWQKYMVWEREFQRGMWEDIEGVWGVFDDYGGR